MGPGRLHPDVPPIFDFGGDRALEVWMCGGFMNCECRSVLAEFTQESAL